MRRLLPLAVLLAAFVLGAVLLRRPNPHPLDTGGALVVARTADADVLARVEPTPAETAASPVRATVRATTQPSPTAAPDGAALRSEADRLIAAGKIAEGLDALRKAVDADPTAKNHGDLGALLYRLTAFDESAIHLRAAAELDPTNADRWVALANVYYRKVNPGEAWKAEARARQAEPGLELGRDADGMRVRKGETVPRSP
jgi:tetratricopeptide (TPR) repeat protein